MIPDRSENPDTSKMLVTRSWDWFVDLPMNRTTVRFMPTLANAVARPKAPSSDVA
jgi:hypothetical protein